MKFEKCQRDAIEAAMCSIGNANKFRRAGRPQVAIDLIGGAISILVRVLHAEHYGTGDWHLTPPAMLKQLFNDRHIEWGTYEQIRDAGSATGEYGDGSDVRNAITAAKTLASIVRVVRKAKEERWQPTSATESNMDAPSGTDRDIIALAQPIIA